METEYKKVTELQLTRARMWHKDFACVNDSYNLAKYKMTAAEMGRILTIAGNCTGNLYTATMREINARIKRYGKYA